MGWLTRARSPAALYERGLAANREQRLEEALKHFHAAAAAAPDNPDFLYALGTALLKMDRPREALQPLRAGHALRPEHVEMHYNLAAALMSVEEYEAAYEELERLAARAPGFAPAHSSLGYLQRQFGRMHDALCSYRRALELDPRDADTHSNLLLTLCYSAEHGRDEILREHRAFGARHAESAAAPEPDPTWPRRLRIGYVSPDLRSHVVACFLWPILAHHDRDHFEVFCYFTHPTPDAVTQRLRALSDHWRECGALSDEELAARVRADRIDILVDLAGHTAYQRLKVFARRPAPVQATYLGYPNTTGLAAIDYRITDGWADPPGEADADFVESLVRLPRAFVCYRPGPDLHAVQPPPAERNGYITFGCFNNFQKLSAPFFDAAAQLLHEVPGSRLFLKAKPLRFQAVAAGVRQRFARAQIDPARLTLRGWEPSVEAHLAAYHEVDIALDSFPYNGTTTTCEAMWMGVPVLTVRGDRHAARVGATLLRAVGLQEHVARDAGELVRIGAALAADRARLARLRAGMRERLRASELMDETGFVRELERCYVHMWRERVLPARSGTTDAIEAWRAHSQKGDHVAALQALGDALVRQPDTAQLHYLKGCTLEDLTRPEEATACYRQALELDPGHAKAANNLGALLEMLGRTEEAAPLYRQALQADPGLPQALYNLGNLHKQRGEYADAAELLGKAVAALPDRADWHCALGEVHLVQWQVDEAIASQRAAIASDPAYARAHAGLGNALQAIGAVGEAEACFRRALELDPGLREVHSNLLLALHYRKGDEAATLHAEHLAWASRHAPSPQPLRRARPSSNRLRIGYVSSNFHRHSVASFIEPVLAAHERKAHQIFCYANVAFPDAVTRRLASLCDEWRDIHGVSDEEVVRRVQEDGIDVLVDLAGHTGGGRLGVFARRAAPVQVNWLGYPNTTGLSAMDYRLTDELADPPEAERYYTEKLVRLEGGFLCYGPPAETPPVGPLPALKSGRVTFGSFNNLAKAGEQTLELWGRILRAVPGSRLLLKAHGLGSRAARERLLERLAAQGIGEERLELVGPERELAAHLGRYGEVDIALDTYPYHGTTTTCEALWMGVPVITLAGRTHVSRVGLSVLTRVGLCELVAQSAEEYVQKALALAQDVGRLETLRTGMRERLRASPLMDARAFARSIEAAYRSIAVSAPASVHPAKANGEALRLHVGGKEIKPGWKILNVQPGPGVDYIGDCTDLSAFPDASVSEIYASHVLEHLGYQSALPKALAEFHRVLVPGGRAMISVPDFEVICRLFLDPRASKAERIHLMRIAFGGQTDDYDFHHVGLTWELFGDFLARAGFSRMERTPRFDLFHDSSRVEVLGMAISLNVVAYK